MYDCMETAHAYAVREAVQMKKQSVRRWASERLLSWDAPPAPVLNYVRAMVARAMRLRRREGRRCEAM